MQSLLNSPVFVLFAVLSVGMALGRITIKGVSLGSSGVLFAALLAGHFHLRIPQGVTELGTAIFVYCVGLGVGNRFFASLCSKGSKLVLLSLLVVGTAWGVTLASCMLFHIDSAIGVGLFAGACTSTPGLAAAAEALQSAGRNTDTVNIGYGVAYPFGVIGVVLFVQLLPRLLKRSLDDAEGPVKKDPQQIITRVVHVSNAALIGRRIMDCAAEGLIQCRITRILENDLLVPLPADAAFLADSAVLMVGTREQLARDARMVGSVDNEISPGNCYADEKAEVIVLEKTLSNRTLRELNTPERDGVIVSCVTRLGVTFVPTEDTEILRNDVLTVVGRAEQIAAFRKKCRHRSAAIGATDIMSLAVGLMLGIMVGKITIGGGPDSAGFSLGLAGGPLVVALILGHFGHIGPIAGYMPRNTRVLLMEFALMLFLAGAGISGGATLVETLRQHGITMFLVGVAITAVPLAVGYLFARRVLHLPLAEALGGICGSMTSTPALGAITVKTDKQAPVISYATAYPAALILMAVLAKWLVGMF